MIGRLGETAQYRAVFKRDKRYDGVFYFAKKGARIYCRPSCSRPHQQREGYSFFGSIQDARARGLVACRYCHPTRLNNDLPLVILNSIDIGAINEKGVHGLAYALHISEQHLRRIVRDKTGDSPVHLNNERRLEAAKRLITQTKSPITEVAFNAGFSSIRQFNNEFKKAFKVAPREMRKAALVWPSVRLYGALFWIFRLNR